ncbi:MAG: hypothetical protein D6802_07670 [Ardenticatenia bacterium]|nr:MAG: hypothetical protein D6802_07670 [Ardenticatenia bacterium]
MTTTYTRLAAYPRPPNDNGWGFHSSSGAYEQPWMSEAWRVRFSGKSAIQSLTDADKRHIMREYARMLHDEYGVRWFKLLAGGTAQLDFLDALVEAGIETIVRLWTDRPHPHYVAPTEVVQQFLEHGAHYIEWGNEPNLFLEWESTAWHRGNLEEQLLDQIERNLETITTAALRAGVQGIPLIPSLSPGGNRDARIMFSRLMHLIRERNLQSDFTTSAVAIHNRPHNIPPHEPATETLSVTFREYEWYDEQIRTTLGYPLPLLGTEAGYEIGDATIPGYPRITGDLHATYNMEIFRGFRETWRPSFFCACMWLIEIYEKNSFSFANAAWWYNKIAGGDYSENILPAVHALREEAAQRIFVRTMPWETPPPPASSFADILLAEANARQVIEFNPNAALQQRIFADGFVPNSPEFALEFEGETFIAQRAEHLQSGEVRVYYVKQGEWTQVKFIRG